MSVGSSDAGMPLLLFPQLFLPQEARVFVLQHNNIYVNDAELENINYDRNTLFDPLFLDSPNSRVSQESDSNPDVSEDEDNEEENDFENAQEEGEDDEDDNEEGEEEMEEENREFDLFLNAENDSGCRRCFVCGLLMHSEAFERVNKSDIVLLLYCDILTGEVSPQEATEAYLMVRNNCCANHFANKANQLMAAFGENNSSDINLKTERSLELLEIFPKKFQKIIPIKYFLQHLQNFEAKWREQSPEVVREHIFHVSIDQPGFGNNVVDVCDGQEKTVVDGDDSNNGNEFLGF
ncbi:unnamed protein product [Caenorhabditis bovis]|uniref:Lin-15A/B-like domain-containing protein n=1 Tax=Caenorhabditis bovis TaxID=2654633 RepID=A0A8S1EBG8_9PELO|nr:unnamed protein product [Caenorhabditis bovis]